MSHVSHGEVFDEDWLLVGEQTFPDTCFLFFSMSPCF